MRSAEFGSLGLLGLRLAGISPTDPVTFGGIGLLFAPMVALPSHLPAWWAARLDPVSVLREE